MLIILIIEAVFISVAAIIHFVYGIRLYKKDLTRFNNIKGIMEYSAIGATVSLTLIAVIFSYYSIQSSTEDFSKVTQRFDNIISIFNRKPVLRISFDIDRNDTTFEITSIKLQNDGDITAHVYMMKIVMPNTGFKVKDPDLPPDFKQVFTYDKENYIYQSYYPLYYQPPYPPKFILPPNLSRQSQSIDITRCDIIYDKHLNKQFSVFVYYSSLYGYDGWVDTSITIYKP